MSDSKKDKDAEAKKRSDAARKAAATRERNKEAEASDSPDDAPYPGDLTTGVRPKATEPQVDNDGNELLSPRPEPVPVSPSPMHGVPRRRLARDEAAVKEAKKG